MSLMGTHNRNESRSGFEVELDLPLDFACRVTWRHHLHHKVRDHLKKPLSLLERWNPIDPNERRVGGDEGVRISRENKSTISA